MKWYGNISKPSGEYVLHICDLQASGLENIPLESPADVRRVLADHPEVRAVNFYAGWMPQRAVPVASLTEATLRRLWDYRPRPAAPPAPAPAVEPLSDDLRALIME